MSALVVGIGNPGRKYKNTRHNAGFMVLDALAAQWGVSFQKGAGGEILRCRHNEKEVILLKPDTYVNLSGNAVGPLVGKEGIAFEKDLLVVSDDVDTEFDTVRLRSQGSSGGHNGLKSIEEALESRSYPRLKIGVGRGIEADVADHVLGEFTLEEQNKLPEIIERAIAAITLWLDKGIDSAMRSVNI